MRARCACFVFAIILPATAAGDALPCDIIFAGRAPRVVSFEMPSSFAPGGNLFLLTRQRELINLTRLDAGDVADPCVSPDAQRVAFSLRKDARSPWKIVEMDLATRRLRPRSAGPGNDLSPCYLADGAIVFCSDRAGILDEYGRGPVSLLHRMDPNGSVRPISFTMSHDYEPTVARNGALIFCRWLNLPGAHLFPLFTANPDGNGMFGFAIDRGDFGHRLARPVEMPDGRLLAIAIPRGARSGAGRLTRIDPHTAIESGPAPSTRQDLLPDLLCRTVSPLPSGDLLVSCCRADDVQQDLALWAMAPDGGNRRLIHDTPLLWDEGAVAVAPRTPPALRPSYGNPAETTATVGALNVYENTGVRASLRCERDLIHRRGTIRGVRAVEGITATASVGESLRAIRDRIIGMDRWRVLGEAPVAADGSFLAELPANRPIRFQTAGHDGRALTEESNWFYAVPGEKQVCGGCHPPTSATSSNKALAAIQSNPPYRLRQSTARLAPQRTLSAKPDDCQDCHGGIAMNDWQRTDAHATSHSNARFLDYYRGTNAKGASGIAPGYKLDFPNTDGACAACHAPNAALDNPWGTNPPAVADRKTDGAHCVVCHRVRAMDLTDLGSRPGIVGMELRTPGSAEHFFMGPYDDVHSERDVYMPPHARSEFCAPCHEGKFWGTSAYSTYSEYLNTPEARNGVRCQDCHMPSEGTMPVLAPAGQAQDALPPRILSHVNRTHEAALVRETARLEVQATAANGALDVTVSVTNAMGGHHLPTGFPERNLVLLVTASVEGKPLTQTDGERIPPCGGEGPPEDRNYADRPGKIFAKVLCDEMERFPAPMWRRTIILSDTRIAAHETDRSQYRFALPEDRERPLTLEVHATLLYRRFFRHTLAAKGWDLPDQVVVDKRLMLPAR